MSEVSKRVRDLVLERDRHVCVICGRGGEGLNLHHRRLRQHGSEAERHLPSNLITVCGSGTTGCHGEIHADPRASYARGWMVHSYSDPLTTPVDTCHGRLLLDDEGGFTDLTDRRALV